jgi:hypothetical protein
MSRILFMGAAALAMGLAGAPAFSQHIDVDIHDDESAVGQPMLFVSGGGNNSLRQFQDDNDDDFDIGSELQTGFNVGGGLGVQFNRWAALRATYNFARSQGEGGTFSPLAGNHFNRHYYGADLQFRGDAAGFSPYLAIGGGAVTVSPDDDALLLSPTGAQFSNESFTKPAGKLGLGFDYQFPNTGFGIFAEGSGWVYKWDRYGLDRTQVDTNWGAGLTYRFGY